MPPGDPRNDEQVLRLSYEILGVQPGASAEEIKAAYRDLAKVWHPDRFPNDERLQRKGAQRLSEINRAYEVIHANGFRSPQGTRDSTPAPETAEPIRTPPRVSERQPENYSSAQDVCIATPARIVPQGRRTGTGIFIFCGVLLGAALGFRFAYPVGTRTDSQSEVRSESHSLTGSSEHGKNLNPQNGKDRLLKSEGGKQEANAQVWVDFSSKAPAHATSRVDGPPQSSAPTTMASPEVVESGMYVLETLEKLDAALSADPQNIESRLRVADRVVETFATSPQGQALPVFSEAARSALMSYSTARTAKPDEIARWMTAARNSTNEASRDFDYYRTTGQELQPDVSPPARAWKKVRKTTGKIWHASD